MPPVEIRVFQKNNLPLNELTVHHVTSTRGYIGGSYPGEPLESRDFPTPRDIADVLAHAEGKVRESGGKETIRVDIITY